MRNKFVFTFLLLWAVFSSYAQFSVTAALDSTTILLGDQVQLHFTVTLPHGADYESPDFQKQFDTLSFVEIIDVAAPKTITKNSTQQTLLITSFEEGKHQIPSFSFSTQVAHKNYNAISNPVFLEVNPMAIDSIEKAGKQFRKDIITEPLRLSDWIHWVYIPLLSLAALLGLYFIWKKIKKSNTETKEKQAPKKIIPAHVLAFRQLDELKEKRLWQQGNIKEYHSEISMIAREYLENRFHFNALESVTPEIIPKLKEQAIDTEWQEKITRMLTHADMVKFAKFVPMEKIHTESFDVLYSFIEKTQFIPPTNIESTEEE